MKIGIMTFHAAPNHGAVLQAFALQTQLQKMGHEPYFINYQRGIPLQRGLLGWIGSTPSNMLHKINTKMKRKPFSLFQRENLIIGDKEYLDHIQLHNDPPLADAYICGSDQIWNPIQINLEKDEHAFWLDFGNAKILHIAYAASFGTPKLSDQIIKKYTLYAKKFNAISVREKSAVDIVEKLEGPSATWVPDPTLLLSQNEYRRVETQLGGRPKPFLFSYQIESKKKPLALAAQINNFLCNEFNLSLYESLSLSFQYNILHNRYIGPGEWLAKLRQSSFVFTNSFHATVFSLLFQRPFIVLFRTGATAGLNNRIGSLLDLVGLQHRAVTEFDSGNIKKLYQEEIDWSSTDSKIYEFRKIGLQFLDDALK